MALKLTRNNVFTDSIFLGEEEHVFTFTINETRIREMQNAMVALADANKAHEAVKQLNDKENTPEKIEKMANAIESFGLTIMNLFALCFGRDLADKIFAFYEGSYLEMTVDLIPYISETILPEAKKMNDANKKQKANKYLR